MTFTVPRIAVVGSLHYDILVMGDDRPRRGETLIGDSWAWKCGGKGGNQAIEAARHGAAVAFVGAVGKTGSAMRFSLSSCPQE
jgi:ribokinase